MLPRIGDYCIENGRLYRFIGVQPSEGRCKLYSYFMKRTLVISFKIPECHPILRNNSWMKLIEKGYL